MKLSIIALRNITRNKRRSLLSGIAIAISTLIIVFMFSLIEGMKADLSRNIFTYVSGHIRIRNAEYEQFETLNPLHLGIQEHTEIIESIRGQDNIRLVLPRIRFFSAIYRHDKNYRGMGMGIDFAEELFLKRGMTGRRLLKEERTETAARFEKMDQREKLEEFGESWSLTFFEGELPRNGEKEILLATGLAEEMDVGIGEKVTFYTKTAYMGMQAWTFRITGVVSFPIGTMNRGLFIAPFDSVQRFLKMDSANNMASEITVHVNELADLSGTHESLIRSLESAGHKDLEVKSWQEIGSYNSWVNMAETTYNIVAFFFFLLGTTVIVNTTMMVIYERMKEIGTIAAMGMTGREIMVLFFLEAFFIGLIAAFVGVLLGVGITVPLAANGLDYGEVMENVDMGISTVIYPVLNLRSTVFVYLYSIGVASLASFIPTRRAAKIQPAEALKSV
jgi:putative ABC transport system permease protein